MLKYTGLEVLKIKLKTSPFYPLIFYFCFFFSDIVFSELTVRFFSLGLESGISIFIILFSVSIAFLFAAVCAFTDGTARKILSYVFAAFIFLVLVVQLVYHRFCNSFMSVAQLGMGGDALTHFGEAALLKIHESLGGILLLLLPIIVLVFIKAPKAKRLSAKTIIVAIALFFALHFLAVVCLPLGGTEIYSPYDTYKNTFVLDKSARHFGLITTLRLEIRTMLFGDNEKIIISDFEDDAESGIYNITDIDFAKLAENEDDPDIKELHQYFASVNGTKQNKYTGKFEGYNLIMICAESFSHHVISKELTPTLYKLANEGFRFNNYYNTVCDNTSNGEYALLTGLVPDTSLLGQGWKTFYYYNSLTTSQDNLMPFCLGNQFAAEDKPAYAIHNHTASYYGRNKTHPNLGYTFIAFNQGLKAVETYPTSDVSMMEQTMPLLLEKNENGEIPPFHAYFLTFSGHMPYIFDYRNDMALRNQQYVKKLDYSSKVKAYIACQIELEKAVKYMISELEKSGVLDNTLIVLTNDHYPYPLGLDYLSELAGEKLDPHFDQYRSGLILWSSSMEKPVEVDVPCCSLDVLPTLSNMLGLTYDSRLLSGRDIFAEGPHIAILQDRSFITDKVMYNCTDDEYTLCEGKGTLEEGYLEKMQAEVRNRFTVAEKILYTDYYRALYEK